MVTYADIKEQACHWRPETSTLPDGRKVSFAFWEVAQPQGYALLAPGRNEVHAKYTPVARRLAGQGYASLCWDPQTDVHSFDEHLDAFGHIFENVWRSHAKGQHAIVLGHSTGAHVAARYLATGEERIDGADGLILTAPLAGMNYRRKFLPDWFSASVVEVMGCLAPNSFALGQKPYSRATCPFEGNRWTSDAENFAWMQDMFDDPELGLRPDGAKWGWVRAGKHSCAQLDHALGNLRIPTLVFTTPNDRSVSGPAQGKFAQCPHAEIVELPESRHEVLMENPAIQARVWDKVGDFLGRLRQQRPPSL